MYHGKNDETYGEMEESILACILIDPTLIEKLRVDERHFKKFDYILTFFKSFYEKYNNLDISIMFTIVKNSSEMTLMDAITYLLDIFVLPSHFEEYQDRLIDIYKKSKKEEWLRKKIYEKATKLYVGKITVKQFNNEIKRLYEQAEKIEWK